MGGSHYRFIAIPEFFLFILKLVKLNKNLASFCHHPTLRDCEKNSFHSSKVALTRTGKLLPQTALPLRQLRDGHRSNDRMASTRQKKVLRSGPVLLSGRTWSGVSFQPHKD